MRNTSAEIFVFAISVIFIAIMPAMGFSADNAAASPPVPEILAKMEKTISGFDDQRMDVIMTIIDTNGTKKSYDFTVYQKGEDKRLAVFNSGELKGMATLVEDRNRVYVYLPGFKKVRRVAAHNMNQSLAGSDFSNEDMATVSYSKKFDIKMDKEDKDYWYLMATPKTGEDSEYAKLIIKVAKEGFYQINVDYFNKAGEKVKVFTMSDFKDYHGIKRSSKVVLSDPRTKHATELDIKDFVVNQGLKDEMFTVRQLQWGGK